MTGKNCTVLCEVGVARVSRTNVTPGNLVAAGQTVLCRVTSLDPILTILLPSTRRPPWPTACCIFDTKQVARPAEPAAPVEVRDRDEGRGRLPAQGGGRLPRPGDRPGDRHPGGPRVVPEPAVPAQSRGLGPGPGGGRNPRKAITVPEVAVGSQQRQKYLYAVNDKDEVEFRPVVLGPVREVNGVRLQVVESGVSPADRVVVNGLLRVRPGVKVQPKPAPPLVPPAANGNSKS